jgi:hypothetical protein
MVNITSSVNILGMHELASLATQILRVYCLQIMETWVTCEVISFQYRRYISVSDFSSEVVCWQEIEILA